MTRALRIAMIDGMRAVTAALVGALCGVGWLASIKPAGRIMCGGGGLGCVFFVALIVVPALAIVWTLVAWGLLKVARFSPAWPTAFGGIVGTMVLLFVSRYVFQGVHIRLPEDGDVVVWALASFAAGGYALAAVVTARYGGRRDRTEHRGQDG